MLPVHPLGKVLDESLVSEWRASPTRWPPFGVLEAEQSIATRTVFLDPRCDGCGAHRDDNMSPILRTALQCPIPDKHYARDPTSKTYPSSLSIARTSKQPCHFCNVLATPALSFNAPVPLGHEFDFSNGGVWYEFWTRKGVVRDDLVGALSLTPVKKVSLREAIPAVIEAQGVFSSLPLQTTLRRPKRSRTIYCSQLNLGSVVLIGDAAHAMQASLGQGVNCALGEQEHVSVRDSWLLIRPRAVPLDHVSSGANSASLG